MNICVWKLYCTLNRFNRLITILYILYINKNVDSVEIYNDSEILNVNVIINLINGE